MRKTPETGVKTPAQITVSMIDQDLKDGIGSLGALITYHRSDSNRMKANEIAEANIRSAQRLDKEDNFHMVWGLYISILRKAKIYQEGT